MGKIFVKQKKKKNECGWNIVSTENGLRCQRDSQGPDHKDPHTQC